MINLLPPDEKRQLAASRSNTLLLRYNIFMIGVLAFVGLAIGITYVYLNSTQAAAEKQVAENKSKVSNYNQVQEQEKVFKSNLATAKEILDKEVVYTKAILAIANLLPSGVVLQTLTLDAKTLGTPTTLIFQTKSVDAALNLKKVLETSSTFKDVHFQNIESITGPGDYPVTATLNVTIDKAIALNEGKQ